MNHGEGRENSMTFECVSPAKGLHVLWSEQKVSTVSDDDETLRSQSSSGSNQARKGRLVNALAARGDERRDTLR